MSFYYEKSVYNVLHITHTKNYTIEKSIYNVLHITHTKKTNINLNSVCFFASLKLNYYPKT